MTKSFIFREGISLNVRFELFNGFNRLRSIAPSNSNPLAARRRDANGVPISGFGWVNAPGSNQYSGSSSTPALTGSRVGQLNVRLVF